MHRGVLLLPWLAVAALASWAIAEDEIAPVRQPRAAESNLALSPSGPPIASESSLPMPEMVRAEPEELPARYIAQHPNPDEPLGFSGARFAPQPGPVVDPAMTSGVFDVPIEPFYESPDPHAPAPTVSSGDWLRSGHWYMEQSAVYVTRTPSVKNDVRLAFEFITPFNLDENTLDVALDPGFEPGLQSTLGRYLGCDAHNRSHSVEFTFLGLTHWKFGESITAETPGTVIQLIDPFADVPVYDDSDFQGFTQSSDFNSYEVNYRIDRRLGRDRMVYSRDSCWVREATPTLLCSAFAGVRVAIINESIDWTARNVLGTGRYFVVTHNNMVGPQVGAELFYERAYWRAGARVKTGALVNWASQSTTVRILDNAGAPLSPNRDELVKDHTLAFVGGIGFIGEYRFRPSFGLRVSYDLLWATDLALAQNQITFFPSTPPEISGSHSLFFQGVSLGFEWFR
ncbi:MAG: hypothetical protein WD063_00010 [Pirellulales bacterium]